MKSRHAAAALALTALISLYAKAETAVSPVETRGPAVVAPVYFGFNRLLPARTSGARFDPLNAPGGSSRISAFSKEGPSPIAAPLTIIPAAALQVQEKPGLRPAVSGALSAAEGEIKREIGSGNVQQASGRLSALFDKDLTTRASTGESSSSAGKGSASGGNSNGAHQGGGDAGDGLPPSYATASGADDPDDLKPGQVDLKIDASALPEEGSSPEKIQGFLKSLGYEMVPGTKPELDQWDDLGGFSYYSARVQVPKGREEAAVKDVIAKHPNVIVSWRSPYTAVELGFSQEWDTLIHLEPEHDFSRFRPLKSAANPDGSIRVMGSVDPHHSAQVYFDAASGKFFIKGISGEKRANREMSDGELKSLAAALETYLSSHSTGMDAHCRELLKAIRQNLADTLP